MHTQNKSTAPGYTAVIRKGWGFDVGQNFARANEDTPVELAESEYAGGPRWVIGYIAENPAASLGFLKYGHQGKVRCRLERRSIAQV